MKRLLFASLCSLLAACAAPFAKLNTPTPPPPPVESPTVLVVGAVALSNHLCDSVGWCPLEADPIDLTHYPLDSRYVVPNSTDIAQLVTFYTTRKEFAKFYVEAWDCDDIAREFMHYSRVWTVQRYSKAPVAIAVALAYVRVDGDISDIFPGNHRIVRGLHVLNLILRDDGQWFFFEPQTLALAPVESMLFEGSITIMRVEL